MCLHLSQVRREWEVCQFFTTGCTLALLEMQSEIVQDDYCIIFMVAEFSCFCLVLFAAVGHTLFVGQTLETPNAPLAAAGRSGWVWRDAWLQSTIGHRYMTMLTLPISCLTSSLGGCDLLFIFSADKGGDGRRSPLFLQWRSLIWELSTSLLSGKGQHL